LAVGEVVYLAKDGEWTLWVDEAWVSATDAEAAEMLAMSMKSADACFVVEPYLIDVTLDGKAVKPVRWREQIKAEGPPIHAHLGKQAMRR
jgi:hypothetical protein